MFVSCTVKLNAKHYVTCGGVCDCVLNSTLVSLGESVLSGTRRERVRHFILSRRVEEFVIWRQQQLERSSMAMQ